jgi:hypothetical protein
MNLIANVFTVSYTSVYGVFRYSPDGAISNSEIFERDTIMKEGHESSKPNGTKKVNGKGRNGEPVSLYPLSPEEAMRRLLSVPPEPKEKNEHQEVGR